MMTVANLLDVLRYFYIGNYERGTYHIVRMFLLCLCEDCYFIRNVDSLAVMKSLLDA